MRAVTTAMARAETPQEALEALLERLGQDMGWDVGGFWALADDGVLELAAGWSGERVDASEFERLTRQLRLEPGAGLPGQALERRAPVWVDDYPADAAMLRTRAARTAGLHSAVAVPATREGDPVGVIEFLSADLRVRDRATVGALATVGGHIGELLGVLEERHALLRSLETLALTDQLTGLPNRRAWEDTLSRELARAARDTLPVCVAVLDVDGFKGYNDDRGHLAGDALLSQAAEAWRSRTARRRRPGPLRRRRVRGAHPRPRAGNGGRGGRAPAGAAPEGCSCSAGGRCGRRGVRDGPVRARRRGLVRGQALGAQPARCGPAERPGPSRPRLRSRRPDGRRVRQAQLVDRLLAHLELLHLAGDGHREARRRA